MDGEGTPPDARARHDSPSATAAAPPPGPASDGASVSEQAARLLYSAQRHADRLVADTEEAAVQGYQAAEDVLLADLPSAPLFYRLNQGAHSENVDNVIIDAFGRIDAAAVEVVQ